VHHPLAYETGVSPEQAQLLWDSEKAALAASAAFRHQPSTARLLQEDTTCRRTCHRGGARTDRAEPATGSQDGTLRMISVGAIVRARASTC